MRMHLLVLDRLFDLGLSALNDTLTTANDLAPTQAAAALASAAA